MFLRYGSQGVCVGRVCGGSGVATPCDYIVDIETVVGRRTRTACGSSHNLFACSAGHNADTGTAYAHQLATTPCRALQTAQ